MERRRKVGGARFVISSRSRLSKGHGLEIVRERDELPRKQI